MGNSSTDNVAKNQIAQAGQYQQNIQFGNLTYSKSTTTTSQSIFNSTADYETELDIEGKDALSSMFGVSKSDLRESLIGTSSIDEVGNSSGSNGGLSASEVDEFLAAIEHLSGSEGEVTSDVELALKNLYDNMEESETTTQYQEEADEVGNSGIFGNSGFMGILGNIFNKFNQSSSMTSVAENVNSEISTNADALISGLSGTKAEKYTIDGGQITNVEVEGAGKTRNEVAYVGAKRSYEDTKSDLEIKINYYSNASEDMTKANTKLFVESIKKEGLDSKINAAAGKYNEALKDFKTATAQQQDTRMKTASVSLATAGNKVTQAEVALQNAKEGDNIAQLQNNLKIAQQEYNQAKKEFEAIKKETNDQSDIEKYIENVNDFYKEWVSLNSQKEETNKNFQEAVSELNKATEGIDGLKEIIEDGQEDLDYYKNVANTYAEYVKKDQEKAKKEEDKKEKEEAQAKATKKLSKK